VQPDRYCKDCGQELWSEDRFCTGCGRSLHATAHVPTPEAAVPVPPPAPPSQGAPAPAPTPESPQTAGSEAPLVEEAPAEEAPLAPPTPAQAQQPSEPQKASWKPVWGMLAVILVLGFFVTMRGLLSILAITLFLGGIYYVTFRGVTFRGAIFNWPLVIVVGFWTLWFILT
jgi:hypothetical protein